MLIRTLSTTVLEILCKIILNFQVIVKSITDPEDNFKKTCVNGLKCNQDGRDCRPIVVKLPMMQHGENER